MLLKRRCFPKNILLVNPVQDKQDSADRVTCDSDQGAEELDQGQHEGDPKIPRQREEERIAVCCNRMLAETKKKTNILDRFQNKSPV